MKKIIRLSENDLVRLVKKVIKEEGLTNIPDNWPALKYMLMNQYGYTMYDDEYTWTMKFPENTSTSFMFNNSVMSEVLVNKRNNKYVVWPCYSTKLSDFTYGKLPKNRAKEFVGIFDKMPQRGDRNPNEWLSIENDLLRPVGIGKFPLNNTEEIIKNVI